MPFLALIIVLSAAPSTQQQEKKQQTVPLPLPLKEPIELVDQGSDYLLSSSIPSVPPVDLELIGRVLVLPSRDEVLQREEKRRKKEKKAAEETLDLPLANLDGLLTTLFTIPGVRVLSAADVIQNQQRDPLALTKA